MAQTIDQVSVARQVVESGDHQVAFTERIAGPGGLDQLTGEDGEVQSELVVHLVLPLSDEPAGSHDEDSPDVATKHQLLDVQPGHDRLAGAGIIGQEEAQRLPGKHLAVDSDDLMRKWLDQTEMHREAGIEQVSETDLRASATSRNNAPSPSNDQARPCPSSVSSASCVR